MIQRKSEFLTIGLLIIAILSGCSKSDQSTSKSEQPATTQKRGKYGYIIGTSASNDLFANYSAGEIGDEKAYEIARVAPNNDEAQRVGYTYAKTHNAEETAQ